MHIELSRTVVRLSGNDRVTFLQNFCTADIKAMKCGDLSEAFVLNTKGKLVGHVLVLCHDDFLELNTVPDQAQELIQHLDRYLIREDVELSEVELNCVFCFGDLAAFDERIDLASNQFKMHDAIRIAKCEVAGLGILLSSDHPEPLAEYLSEFDQFVASQSQLEFHRIQDGTPWFGVDSNSNTLPQELCRDEKAISFDKGCYLGQETVARIDALGRVNKLLVRLEAESPMTVGEKLLNGEKEVGSISSVATDGEKYVGLAVVRRDAAGPGTKLNDAQIVVG